MNRSIAKTTTILKNEVAYKRFITVWNRTTQFDDGRIVEWDVAGHDSKHPTFVVVFIFNTSDQTTCILNEYCQGTNEMKYTCVAGSYDRKKHTSILEAAKQELSEEAYLKKGQWVNLMPDDQSLEGISELKWGTNKFIPYLCIDPIQDQTPRERDFEENIEVVRNVTIDSLKRIIIRGSMLLPSVQTSWMAIEYLKDKKFL